MTTTDNTPTPYDAEIEKVRTESPRDTWIYLLKLEARAEGYRRGYADARAAIALASSGVVVSSVTIEGSGGGGAGGAAHPGGSAPP